MYERMLNKQKEPTLAEMAAYCGENAGNFTLLNEWLAETYGTEQRITFPYGNQYGWGVAHRKKQKLVCNIFAEDGAFSVMVRLTDTQFESVYAQLLHYSQEYIDHKYPCNDGGWIQYRVTCQAHLEDIKKILSVKCTGK